jgi:hypothetical protein
MTQGITDKSTPANNLYGVTFSLTFKTIRKIKLIKHNAVNPSYNGLMEGGVRYRRGPL